MIPRVKTSVQLLRDEMWDFYQTVSRQVHQGHLPAEFMAKRDRIWLALDAYEASHPEASAVLLKARLHEEIAEQFDPILFTQTPFFFEMGLRYSESWGVGCSLVAGNWYQQRHYARVTRHPDYQKIRHFGLGAADANLRLWKMNGVFDIDHHCLGYTTLLRKGLVGIIAEIDARLAVAAVTPAQVEFLTAARRSNLAMIRVAARFGQKAEALLDTATDPLARKHLTMIAAAAAHVPAHPPRTFYEGLAMLWFLREAAGTMEGIGISVIGHLDRLLIGLYRQDRNAGRLTEGEARDLLMRWMLPTDVKFHVWDNVWPETSTCMELGGCDEEGHPLFNELTQLIIEVHQEHHLINPKLNCRYGSQSPKAYIDLVSRSILAGHNNFALINDDVLIPANVKMGKTEREARLYVNGGCQETMVEGVEHSAGAYYYYNLPRTLDLCLQPDTVAPEFYCEAAAPLGPPVIAGARDFDDFYGQYMAILQRMIGYGTEWHRNVCGDWGTMHPCPFFSSTLVGCIENGKDYASGGAKYNPGGISYVGFGTMVDSLFAIKKAVYEDGWLSLSQLSQVLAKNWDGQEALRLRLLALPKFGHGDAEIDVFAARVSKDLAEIARNLTNERGGPFQPSFFVYYAFKNLAVKTRATPDGRRAGDFYSQGVSPARLRPPKHLTDVLHSLQAIDFTDYPGNAVLDLQLPLGGKMPVATLAEVIYSFARMGGPTLQLNCVTVEEMNAAQLDSQQHQNLVVRISGLSAYFVGLKPEVQDELINRVQLSM